MLEGVKFIVQNKKGEKIFNDRPAIQGRKRLSSVGFLLACQKIFEKN